MRTLILAALLGAVGATGVAQAQMGQRPRYDPRAEVVLKGTIERVLRAPDKDSPWGVHLIVRTSGQRIVVHLGPAWYLERRRPKLEVGDRIKVLGARAPGRDQVVVIAKVVTKGKQSLILRDSDGRPRWRGRGRQGGRRW